MLTPRLMMISNNITTKTIADIGTDHAYIPIYIVQNDIANKVIATDIKYGPLLTAKKNIEKYKLANKIDLRLGSGLSPICENEIETIIIAGMGCDMIKNILIDDEKKARSASFLLLQPMTSQAEVRKWLSANNYSILNEDIAIEENKVYNLIIAKSGKPNFFKDELDYHLPHYLYNHKYFVNLKEKKRREFTKIRIGMEKAINKNNEEIEKYSKLLFNLERI